MSADGKPFEFDGYELRPAIAEDDPLAGAWVDADPHHAGKMGGSYWTEQGPGIDSYALTQGGETVLFFRIERVVRIHVQFSPTHAKRNRHALESGMRWLGMALGRAAVCEVIFDSTAKLLRRFCVGKLGMQPAPDTMSRRLAFLPPRPQAAPDSEQQG